MLQVVDQDNETMICVPLKNVNIQSTIRSFAADVTITQVFRNDEAKPIEAVYCFPIEEKAAIYGFTACIDDREIIAELKEKPAAQQEYIEALKQGHGAYLMEQDEKSQDNFIINIGGLPPSKECTITISYVTELELVLGSIIRFVIPTTIAPRYNPQHGGITSPAGTNVRYVQTSPYSIDFCCQVEKLGESQIARINSSSHPIEIDLTKQDYYLVKLAQQNTHLDRDIIIDIELEEKHENLIAVVEPGAIMATLTPTDVDCQRLLKSCYETNEFIFVIDCSGSMNDENKIGLVRQALLLFLKSLPMNCYFNIIRFGSTYVSLFDEITVIYNETNAQKAEELVKTIQADLGGTELLKPLQWLEQHLPSQERSRQIFLLTDGEISNVTEVLDLCRSMALSTRIFSFGLGHAPSRSLVKGLARSTNGRFVFIPPNTTVDVHVGEQLQKALQPCFTNVKVKWNLGTTSVETTPSQIPPVYAKDRLIIYGLIDNKSSSFDHDSSVELHIDQQILSVARIHRIPTISENGMIARLAAKALILELQHAKCTSQGSRQMRFQGNVEELNNVTTSEIKEIEKKRIIDLSLKYNILCPHTAFIGIEKRRNGNNTNMVLREVPIQISIDDWHTRRRISLMPIRYVQMQSLCSSQTNNIVQRRLQYYSTLRSPCILPLDANRTSYVQQQMGAVPFVHINPQYIHETSNHLERTLQCCVPSVPIPYSRPRSRSPTNNNSSYSDNNSYSSHRRNIKNEHSSSEWPTDDQDIVRYLIDKQDFNGLWHLDDESIRHLTGKILSDFELIHTDASVVISGIILILLETRFNGFTFIWHGVAQKARTILIDKLGKDPKDLETLLENIRKKLYT